VGPAGTADREDAMTPQLLFGIALIVFAVIMGLWAARRRK
jgi:hypothetical protein